MLTPPEKSSTYVSPSLGGETKGHQFSNVSFWRGGEGGVQMEVKFYVWPKVILYKIKNIDEQMTLIPFRWNKYISKMAIEMSKGYPFITDLKHLLMNHLVDAGQASQFSGHENSTNPLILTSNFSCRTSKIVEIFWYKISFSVFKWKVGWVKITWMFMSWFYYSREIF